MTPLDTTVFECLIWYGFIPVSYFCLWFFIYLCNLVQEYVLLYLLLLRGVHECASFFNQLHTEYSPMNK